MDRVNEILSILANRDLLHIVPLTLTGITMLSAGVLAYFISKYLLEMLQDVICSIVDSYRKQKIVRSSQVSPKLKAIIDARKKSAISNTRKAIGYAKFIIPEIVLTSTKTIIIFSVLGALGLATGVYWLNNIGAAIIFSFLCVLLPGQYLSRNDVKRQQAYIAQLSPAIRSFMVALEQRGNVRAAIAYVVDKVPDPTKSLFKIVLYRLDANIPVAEALKILPSEIKLSHCYLFTQLIIEAYHQGPNVLPQLSRLAGQVDTMYDLSLENNHTTASGRLHNVIMHLLIVVIVIMTVYILPEAEIYLTEEPVGRTIVLFTFVSILIGTIFDRVMGKVDY
ncbi:type II secretion system F family protein [Desulfoscipio gibsoniae]